MEQITAALAAQYPDWYTRPLAIGVSPLHDCARRRVEAWMMMLLGAVAFVLLIACVNVANLMLARATARERDVGIRAALGAHALAAGARADRSSVCCCRRSARSRG